MVSRNVYRGTGFKKAKVNINPHIREIEQQIGGTRSAAIARAVRAFREALEQPDFHYTKHTEYMQDYAKYVTQGRSNYTTIYLTDETDADLEAIGQWFERANLRQLLIGPKGYNRRLLIYMALRWYEAYLAG